MRRLFEGIRRIVESAEPGIVDGPAEPHEVDPVPELIYRAEDHPKAGLWEHPPREAPVASAEPIAMFEPSTGWPEALAFTARREPGHGGTFARLSACAADRRLVDAIAADRDRLEAVVDRLRAENRRLLERLAARAT